MATVYSKSMISKCSKTTNAPRGGAFPPQPLHSEDFCVLLVIYLVVTTNAVLLFPRTELALRGSDGVGLVPGISRS